MFAKHINYSKTKGPGDFSPEDGPDDYEAAEYEVFEHVIGDPREPEKFDLDAVILHVAEEVDLGPAMTIVMKMIGDGDEASKEMHAEVGALLVAAAREWFDTKVGDVDICNAIGQAIIDRINEP